MTSAALRVLTLNTGLLRVRLLGRTLLEVPHAAARLRALPAAIASTDADVVCLQEAFRPFRDELVDSLRDAYPHAARDGERRGYTHGLLVLSRHPLHDTSFTRFAAMPAWQRLTVRPGVLATTADVPGAGAVRVLDVHTTAGGGRGPEDAAVERLRDAQLRQVCRLAQVQAQGRPTLLCGDLNAGPEASRPNYERLLAQGWTDPVRSGTTWDPANALNASGLFEDSPPQRVDHVLLDAAADAAFVVERARVLLDEPLVDVAADRVSVSDHAGVLVELRRRPAL